MEVYTPIPDDVVPRTSPPVRRTGWVILGIAVAMVAVLVLRYDPQPGMRYFGTVQTRFGPAGVACGGDTAPRCGEATGVAFAQCTPELRSYFDDVLRN